MTGLDKIIAEICNEAEAEAKETLAAAKAEAKEIIGTAQVQTDEKAAKIAAAAAQDVADIERSRDSAKALQRRQRTLAQKQSLLAETLNAALEKLYALPEGEYFDLVVKLAAKNAQRGAGVLFLSEKDQKRAPKDLAQRIAAALPAGSSLALSDETRRIDGGFVLKYGDVEENCSFAAIFAARVDEFYDLIRPVLFGA